MKQKNCFFAVAASLLIAAASFTSCSNQDNIIGPSASELAGPDEFDEGSLITNGRCEGTETGNFLVYEWRTNDKRYEGAPNIKWDEVTPRNHAIVVEVRGEGDARTAGNATVNDNGDFVGWDSQFFITFGADQVVEAGDEISLTMKVKADEAGTIEPQIHAAPGAYIGSFAGGNINVTTEWTEVERLNIPVSKEPTPWWMGGGKDIKEGFYTIAFNLANDKKRNRFFFDDIRIVVKRHDKWADDNVLTNGRLNDEDMKAFTVAEWVDGEKVNADPANPGNARRVVDPTDLENMCIEVISRDKPAEGEFNPWDAQFFVTFPEALKEGDKVKFEMRVRADKAAKISTQAHAMPSQYIWYVGIGDINATTEWATYEKEFTVSAQQAKGNAGEFQTIAFNLSEFAEANKYYFDDIKLSIIEKAKPVENWETLCEYKGDDAKDFSVKYFKNYVAAQSVDGAIVVESLDPEKVYTEYNNADAEAKLSQDWDTQFLIGLPKKLAAGTKAKLTLKLKADKAANADIQAHLAIPAAGAIEGVDGYAGSYLYHTLISGGAAFTTDWDTFEKEFTVPDDANDMQSICFNLEKLREINKYYFKEIKVEVAK